MREEVDALMPLPQVRDGVNAVQRGWISELKTQFCVKDYRSRRAESAIIYTANIRWAPLI